MTDTIHTYPTKDLIEHDIETDECICGPIVDPVKTPNGSVNWHIIHHSLDGRELNE